jgi:homoserine dehydrogenase
MNKTLKVGVLGFGTVGQGVVKILLKQGKLISARAGRKIEFVKVADLKFKAVKGLTLKASQKTTNAMQIVTDPEIDVVVEVIGGIGIAKKLIAEALKNGKHVVTSNKEVIAKHGEEFLTLAKKNNVNIFYEAVVGGGVPIIHSLKKCLAANKILEFYGIVNGTTNYILSKMTKEGRDFADVLKEAQDLGYAEADPTADVDGYDAAYKLSILAFTAFHKFVSYKNIHFEGIRKITAKDIQMADNFGYEVKLLAIGRESGGQLELKVHPLMISKDHPLAAVQDSYNAIYVIGDSIGETMFYGRGAGELPTASAVVGDIVDIAMHFDIDSTEATLTDYFKHKVKPIGESSSQFFLRLAVKDQPGVLARISSIFGKQKVSIKLVRQQDSQGKNAELVIVTHEVKEKLMQKALVQIAKLAAVKKVESVIRVGLN